VVVIIFDVITLSSVPVVDTAQNIPSSGDHAIPNQLLLFGVVLAVQFIPSGDVIILLSVPVDVTAQNKLSSGDHVTDV